MKRVMVFGTFDRLHPGHLAFFRQARAMGDELVVVVGRDETVKRVKGSYPSRNERLRVKEVRNSGAADRVVLGSLVDIFQPIMEHRPDIICLGYDQNSFAEDLQNELGRRGLDAGIIRLKPYKEEKYKSSILKSGIRKERAD